MLNVSDDFLAIIRESHTKKTVCDMYFDGVLRFEDVPVTEGSLSIDRRAAIRRSGSIKLGDPNLIPSVLTAVKLNPYTIELVVKTGVIFPGAPWNEELVGLGYFTVQTIEWDEGENIPNLTFYDRMKVVERAELLDNYDASGKPADYAINQILDDTLSNMPWYGSLQKAYEASLSIPLIPGGTSYSGSPVDAIEKLAGTMNAEAFFDAEGTFRVETVPTVTVSSPTVWTVDAGANGILSGANRSYSRDGVYNIIRMVGNTDDDKTVEATVQDENPGSPTFYMGPFGKSRKSFQNQALSDSSQCYLAAQKILKETTALATSINMKAVCNPALEEGDIIEVVFMDGSSEIHMIDTMNISFSDGEMDITTKTDAADGDSI